MAKEVAELTIKANVKGAKKEFDDLNKSIKDNVSNYEELNEQVEIQNEVITNLEISLAKLKQQQSVNSDYINGLEKMNQKIAETENELKLERLALKKLNADRKKAKQDISEVEKAQKLMNQEFFRGIQHFQVMGVSLRRVRKMAKAVVPGFKLLFKTIKAGIASTGIGLLLIALTSIGTAMARTGKGAKHLKRY